MVVGQLYSLPPSGGMIKPHPVNYSPSLAGARIGEYCPIEFAEVKAPASETRLVTPWGVFLRTKVENRSLINKNESEIIDAWQRI